MKTKYKQKSLQQSTRLYPAIITALIIAVSLLTTCRKDHSRIIDIQSQTIENVDATGAQAVATITDIGENGIDSHGWCWATTQSPTIEDNKLDLGNKSKTGDFTVNITGLEPGTTYYLRPYASNGEQTVYGEQTRIYTHSLLFNITFPIENAVLGYGLTYNIAWQANISDKVKIELYKADVLALEIANNLVNMGYYNWKVPQGTQEAADYKIKISSVNNSSIIQESPAFSIAAKAIPTVTTAEVEDISYFTASCSGEVIQDNGFEVTARGVCWATTANPTITGNKTEDGSGTGTFTSSLTGLTDNTTYYVRAYATNSAGTAYGEEKTFTTLATGSVTDYDGNTYKTVKIGNQTWMAENLKTTHYADGTAIPLVTDNTAWANLGDNNTDKAYCYYNNNANGEADTYGALYTWAAAMNGASSSAANPSGIQGVCPTGWHLPSDAEWKELEMYLGMSQSQADATGWRGTNEGSKLAGNASLWQDGVLKNDANFGLSGFSALPGGHRYHLNGSFTNVGNYARWWCATENSSTQSWNRFLRYIYSNVALNGDNKSNGFSVRCVKD